MISGLVKVHMQLSNFCSRWNKKKLTHGVSAWLDDKRGQVVGLGRFGSQISLDVIFFLLSQRLTPVDPSCFSDCQQV